MRLGLVGAGDEREDTEVARDLSSTKKSKTLTGAAGGGLGAGGGTSTRATAQSCGVPLAATSSTVGGQ